MSYTREDILQRCEATHAEFGRLVRARDILVYEAADTQQLDADIMRAFTIYQSWYKVLGRVKYGVDPTIAVLGREIKPYGVS